MSVTSPHRPWPADEPSQVYVSYITRLVWVTCRWLPSFFRQPVRLTSTVTLISRTSSFGTKQCSESIASTIPDRRSFVGVCKPLRSSPLAGSVFQADETTAEVKETTKLKPSRIVSTPDFASIPIPPPVAKHSRPRTAEGSQNIFLTSVPRPTSPDTVKESAVSHAFYSGNSAKQASTHLGRSTSSAQSSFSAFPTPAVCPPTRKAGSTPHLRAAFRNPCTMSPTTPAPLLSSKKPSVGRSSSIHRNSGGDSGDSSWLIANPYEVTPKFTRLGLASPHVVLPLCAREHRHLARQNSNSSVKTSTTRISRVRSTDSSSGTSLSSHSQQDALNSSSPSSMKCDLSNRASEPWSSLHLPQTSVAPVTSSGIAVTSEGEASDLQYPSASKSDHYARSAPTTRTSRTSPLVRFKNLTLRTFKSSASLKKSSITPIIDNLTPAADMRLQGEIKIGLLTPRSSSPTASESTADTKAAVVGEFLPPTSRTEQSSKKFWKPFVIWHRNRSVQT